jgi:hypothetical protein
MVKLTRKQREALYRVWVRTKESDVPSTLPYKAFRRTVAGACFDSCVMVPAFGMWLGIETDGYTHS